MGAGIRARVTMNTLKWSSLVVGVVLVVVVLYSVISSTYEVYNESDYERHA